MKDHRQRSSASPAKAFSKELEPINEGRHLRCRNPRAEHERKDAGRPEIETVPVLGMISGSAISPGHRVDAIVRLFGELTYFVVLSDHHDGADFCTTLVYDAHRGEENGMLFAHEQAEILQMEDAATSEDTVWNDLE